MQKFARLLSVIPMLAGSLAAQSDATQPDLLRAAAAHGDVARPDAEPAVDFRVELSGAGIEHRLTGSDEPFLGAVIISLSPRLVPYARGLPGTLTDFVTLGACYGRGGQSFSFVSPLALVPTDVAIHAQGAILNTGGLQVSAVRVYALDSGRAAAPRLGEIVPNPDR